MIHRRGDFTEKASLGSNRSGPSHLNPTIINKIPHKFFIFNDIIRGDKKRLMDTIRA